MKYFFDTEFLEGSQKILFGLADSRPTIDLISIGIVSEDGRKYYAVSKDFNLKEAWNRYDLKKEYPDDTEEGSISRKVYWIRDNVLLPIYREFIHGDMRNHYDFTYSTMKWLLEVHGKSNKQIAFEVVQFTLDPTGESYRAWLGTTDWYYNAITTNSTEPTPEFYAYYSAYDWVAFCWLFGKMIDLPKKFPMYCRDLKQMLDTKIDSLSFDYYNQPLKGCGAHENLEGKLRLTKARIDYPKQDNAHNALDDARWNFKLYQFIMKL